MVWTWCLVPITGFVDFIFVSESLFQINFEVVGKIKKIVEHISQFLFEFGFAGGLGFIDMQAGTLSNSLGQFADFFGKKQKNLVVVVFIPTPLFAESFDVKLEVFQSRIWFKFRH